MQERLDLTSLSQFFFFFFLFVIYGLYFVVYSQTTPGQPPTYQSASGETSLDTKKGAGC